MDRNTLKKKRYLRRRLGIKRKLRAKTGKLRMCVFRSNKNISVQIIDDVKGHTLVAASTMDKDFPQMKSKGNKEAAKALGKIISERALQKGIKQVVFDRNGYLYHGKVKEFAGAARESGLEF
jgi:large subunit ribosomal protein L18